MHNNQNNTDNIFYWLQEKKNSYKKGKKSEHNYSQVLNDEPIYSQKTHLIGISFLTCVQGLLLLIRSILLSNDLKNNEVNNNTNGFNTEVSVQLGIGCYLIIIAFIIYFLYVNKNPYYLNYQEMMFLFLLLTKEILIFEAFCINISYQLIWMPALFIYQIYKNLFFLQQRFVKYYLVLLIIYTMLRICLQYGFDYYISVLQICMLAQMNFGWIKVSHEKSTESLIDKKQQENLQDQPSITSLQQSQINNNNKDQMQACKEITNFYTSILDMIPQGVIIVDHQKKLVECNKTSLQMMDCSRNKLIPFLFNLILQRKKSIDEGEGLNNQKFKDGESEDYKYIKNLQNKQMKISFKENNNEIANNNNSQMLDVLKDSKKNFLSPRQSKLSRSHELEDSQAKQQIALSPINKAKVEQELIQSNKLVDVKKVSFDIGTQFKRINTQLRQNNIEDIIDSLINISHREVDRTFRRSLSNVAPQNSNTDQQQNSNSDGLGLNMNFCDNDTVEFNFKKKGNLFCVRVKLCMLNYLLDQDSISSLVAEPMIIIVIQNITQQVFTHRLEVANQYKTRILASFSHELRTPLNCSINMLELLQPKLNDPLIKDYLKPALHSNYLLSFLINDILDFSSMEKGSFQYHFSFFNIKDAFEECVQLVAQRAQLKNLDFQFVFDHRLPLKIKSDKQRIQQITLNLLNNALKYTMKGKIILTIQQISQQQIKIAVEDTGIGVDNNIKDKIFHLFGQTHINSKQLNSFSSCLGLTISQLLVKGLSKGQSIQIESEPGNGSIFSFTVVDQSNRSRITSYDMKEQIHKLITLRQNSIELEEDDQNDYQNADYEGERDEVENDCNIKDDEHKLSITPKAFYVNNFQENKQIKRNSIQYNNQKLLFQQNEKNLINKVKNEQQSQQSKNIINLPINNIVRRNSLVKLEEQSPTDSLSKQQQQKQMIKSYQIIRLPSQESTINSPGLHEQLNYYVKNKKKCDCTDILIVDDNEFNLYSLKLMLQSYGIKVEATISGFSSLDIIQSKQKSNKDCKNFKIIIMDIDMPLMNGYETTKKILNIYKNNDQVILAPPIIACTAFVEEEEKYKCFDAGMSWFMNKPVSKPDIEYILETYFLAAI